MANQRMFLVAPGVRPFLLAKRMGWGFYPPNQADEATGRSLRGWLDEVERECSGLDVIGLAYEIEPSVGTQCDPPPSPHPRALTEGESLAWHAWCDSQRGA